MEQRSEREWFQAEETGGRQGEDERWMVDTKLS